MTDEPIDLLREATDALEQANEQYESNGNGTAYVGEEHMTECLYALKQLIETREGWEQ